VRGVPGVNRFDRLTVDVEPIAIIQQPCGESAELLLRIRLGCRILRQKYPKRRARRPINCSVALLIYAGLEIATGIIEAVIAEDPVEASDGSAAVAVGERRFAARSGITGHGSLITNIDYRIGCAL